MATLRPRTSSVAELFLFASVILITCLSGCGVKAREDSATPQSTDETAALSDRQVRSKTFTGKTISVKDGDTIVVLRAEEQITVRLEGIDCPESGQAFGSKAKQVVSDLCFGKQVTVQATGKDRYGRTLAHVILPDGSELNRELVRRGYAWWYHNYSTDESLGKLEAEAREHRRGLWSDAKPVAPWDWRASRREKSNVRSGDFMVVSSGVRIVALLPNPNGTDAGHEKVTISNSTDDVVRLQGWKLIDKAGNVFLLSGTVESGESLVVTMADSSMPLNNNGDEVLLIDEDGVGRSRVSYSRSQVRAGVVLRFAR